MKKTPEDAPCSWLRRNDIVKITILPNVIYRFNAIPIKIPMIFFTELEKKVLKFLCRNKRLWITKETLNKKSNGGVYSTRFQTILQGYSHKNSMVLAYNKLVDQLNKIEDPNLSTYNFSHLIFDKGAKKTQWRKEYVQQMVMAKLDHHL